jgi:3-hydroxypropanoate dehydrogenase
VGRFCARLRNIRLPGDSATQDPLFREAHTANTFSDEPVTDHQIRAIYDLVKYAPTSINMQPLRLVVVRSDNARERLVKHMSEGNRDKTASAPAVVILATDIDFHEHLPTVFPHAPQMKDMFAEQTSRAVTAQFNSTLQIGYFLIGVRAAGLAAGPMTGFDAEGLDADFFPDAASSRWSCSTSGGRVRTRGGTDCPACPSTRSSPLSDGSTAQLRDPSVRGVAAAPVGFRRATRPRVPLRPGSSVGTSVRLKSGRSPVRSRPWPRS